jgi:hypothetical protein
MDSTTASGATGTTGATESIDSVINDDVDLGGVADLGGDTC